MRPINSARTYFRSFHPVTRLLFAICFLVIIIATPAAIAITLKHGELQALYILIGAAPPAGVTPLWAAVLLAVTGYALVPAVLALLVAAVFQRRLESDLIDTPQALEKVANLLHDLQGPNATSLEKNSRHAAPPD